MSQKREFVQLSVAENQNMSLLCSRFGISRKTGYKWLRRYKAQGPEGLGEQSRRPLHSPLQTSEEMVQRILDVRSKHPWCGRKIHGYLRNTGVQNIPVPSTITAILRRNGCISEDASEKAKQWQRFERETPNDLWQMDFKGHFATQAGRCHPLTVLDDHSRFCLCLQACSNEQRATVQQRLQSVFRCYGLPWQMNMDNGPPWGAEQQGEYTRLTIWLIRLGVAISFSAPRHPQTNGKDERFHRTLKAEVLQGHDFRDINDVQLSFDPWRSVYNFERPHDALGNAVPGSRYHVSTRSYPEKLPPIEYAPQDVIRRVDKSGRVYYAGRKIRVSKAVCGEDVAVRPTAEDGIVEIYYVRQRLARIVLREMPRSS